MFPQKCPLPREELNTHLIKVTRIYLPNGISIDSAVLAQLKVCPAQTMLHAASVAIGRIYALRQDDAA